MAWLNGAFAWIGLAGALVMMALLAGNRLRGDVSLRRRHDLTWLSWAGVAVYLLHNVEEYGIDLTGRAHAFPAAFCAIFGFAGPVSPCPVPIVVFTAVNVPMFWLAAPAAALISPRHPLPGLAIHGVIAANLMAHAGQGLASGLSGGAIYNPGLFTALLLFLPLAIWVLAASRCLVLTARLFVLCWGLVAHLVLIAAMLLLVHGVVADPRLPILVHLLNAMLLLLVPLLAERWLGRDVWRQH